jgi:4-amino-4-deoxy-L-arabinose transferase-like glycosyltransferase
VEPNSPVQQPTSNQSLAAHIGWAVLILATLYVCYFSHLGAIGFVGPDEPRYAWIARDMAETGDWVTPRLYGKPWFEKPPLLYWGAALSFKLFGVSEAAARLPSAISALLATLALAWLALRLYGAETARWLLLLLPTTVGMIGFSHAAATDMPFSAMLTIAMVAAALVLRVTPTPNHAEVVVDGTGEASPAPTDSSTPWLALILFGFFLGFAVLAKGPAAIVLCGGAVFFWAIFTKRWRDAFRLFHPATIATFCLTALPWYILCAGRNPDFFRVFIIEHNFKRYLTPEFQHIQPFWYYVPILLTALLPWAGWSVSAVIYVFRKQSGMRPDTSSIFLLAWIFFPLIFFSISRSKLPGYILPAIPPFAMLTATSLCRALRTQKVRVPSGFAVLALTPVAVVAALGVSTYADNSRWLPHNIAIVSAIIALVSGTACLVFALTGRRVLLVVSGVLCLVMSVEATNILGLPSVDRLISPRHVAQIVTEYPQSARTIVAFRLKRGWQYGLNFYLHREIEEWAGDSSEPAIAIVSLDGEAELRRRHIGFTVINDSSFEALVIQIGNPDAGKTKPISSRLSRLRAAAIKRNSPRDSHTRACLHHPYSQNSRARYSPARAAPWPSRKSAA